MSPSERGVGPPETEPGAATSAGPQQLGITTPTNHQQPSAAGQHGGADTVAWLRRPGCVCTPNPQPCYFCTILQRPPTPPRPLMAGAPGRCDECGFHVETQGHRDHCTQTAPITPELGGDDNEDETIEDRFRRYGVLPPKPPTNVIPITAALCAGVAKPDHNPAYVDAAVRAELDRLANAQEGTRNRTLITAACAIYELVKAGHVDRAVDHRAPRTHRRPHRANRLRDPGQPEVRVEPHPTPRHPRRPTTSLHHHPENIMNHNEYGVFTDDAENTDRDDRPSTWEPIDLGL